MGGKSWKRQALTDALEPQACKKLCGTPWQLIAPEVRLQKKVTADKEGAGPPLPARIVGRKVRGRTLEILCSGSRHRSSWTHGRAPGCVSVMTRGSARRSRNKECRERESERSMGAVWSAAHGGKLTG